MKNRNLILIIVIGVAATLLTGCTGNSDGDVKSTGTELPKISMNEVEQSDGRDGNKCYIVIDNNVYKINPIGLWADGIHSESGGLARCGKDLSDVIDQSTHGRSKLKLIELVGQLEE